jgi:hypothetical protein
MKTIPYSEKFLRGSILQTGDLYHFILTDTHAHAHYILYIVQSYLLIFVVGRLSAKTAKIGPLKISHYTVLYSNQAPLQTLLQGKKANCFDLSLSGFCSILADKILYCTWC